MVDLTKMAAPKSDQLNADDLIGGPITVRIREVREMGSAEQPLAVYYEGDNGKPYKPGKSMMRALMFAWGPEGDEYVGRSMTLYRDPDIMFGDVAVGGIRISHMSDIPHALEFPLTAKRGKRSLYRVEKLVAAPARKTAAQHVEDYCAAVATAVDRSELLDLANGSTKLVEALEKAGDKGKPMLERMREAERKRNEELNAAEDGPGDDESDGSAEDDLELDDDPFGNEEPVE